MGYNWEEEVAKCSMCGKCHSVCPVYLETGEETMVTRGRISLAMALKDHQIELTDKLRDSVYSCKKCLRCCKICPCDVNFEVIIQSLLYSVAEEMGIPFLPKMVFRWILPRRWLFDLLLKVTSITQRFTPTKKKGPMRHLPLMFMGNRWVPTLSKGSALKQFGGEHKVTNPKMRVAFFTGCLINYVYTDMAEAVVDVLNRLGIEVVVPEKQLCCSLPALSLGDKKAATKLMELNCKVLKDANVDAIVAACGSCAKALKSDYNHIMEDRWEDMSKKVYDISEFIEKFTEYETKPIDKKVTYHDPCHLYWAQNIHKEPRNQLKRSANYVEMKNASSCCGGGGIFTLLHYELTLKIMNRKIDNIIDSGAQVVATNCPGCVMQIHDGMAGRGVRIRALHTIQVLQRALVDKENSENKKEESTEELTANSSAV